MSNLKCDSAYFETQESLRIIKCKVDNQLCGYQFFCPPCNSYINATVCIDCKNYKERND